MPQGACAGHNTPVARVVSCRGQRSASYRRISLDNLVGPDHDGSLANLDLCPRRIDGLCDRIQLGRYGHSHTPCCSSRMGSSRANRRRCRQQPDFPCEHCSASFRRSMGRSLFADFRSDHSVINGVRLRPHRSRQDTNPLCAHGGSCRNSCRLIACRVRCAGLALPHRRCCSACWYYHNLWQAGEYP